MRFGIAILCMVGLLACSPSGVETASDAAPSDSSSTMSSTPASQTSASAAGGDHLDFSCDNPLYAFASGGATLEGLRAALGESNVVEKTDYDAVWWSLYPGDPAREVAVWFDSGGRVVDVRVENSASIAQLGGALRMGDDLAAVQRFNGAPLPLDGNFLQSFVVADSPESLCRYSVNVRSDAPGDHSNGVGSGLRVSALHMSRRDP